MRHIEEIEARIVRFDTRLLAELVESECNALALLQTIPGVDLIGAALLLVEIGTDMEILEAGEDKIKAYLLLVGQVARTFKAILPDAEANAYAPMSVLVAYLGAMIKALRCVLHLTFPG